MPGSPNRSTDHFLPQCSTLLDDGTQCVQRGTHGNPNKPQRRCRMHNEVYQEMYFAYKLAGEQAAHIRAAFGRMPEEVEMRRTFDIGLIEKLQSFLNLYRVVVEHELVLREAHSERFMLTMDDGHLAWHAGIQQEIHTVDNVLRWLRQRKLELLTPSPLLRGHRPRSASSAAPAAPVNTVRRHRRGQSEPAPDSYPMESNTVLNSSPCSHPLNHSTESKNLIPHPQPPNGATETPVSENQSTFPPLEDGANTAIPPAPTTSDAGLQLHMLTPRDVELNQGDPLSLERSLADVDDESRNLQGTASALHGSQAYAKACPPETPSAEREESPIQDARLSVPTGVLNPTFAFPPAPVPEASETLVPQVAGLKKEDYLAVEASQTNEGQCCESLHDPPVQSESIPLEEHPLDGGNPQLSDSQSPVVATALSTSDPPHSNQEAHQELHESASPAKESEKGILFSSTQPRNEGQHSEPQNTSPRYLHDYSSPIPHQQRVSSSDKTFVEIGESLMSFSGLNTSAVAGTITTVVVGAAWLLMNI